MMCEITRLCYSHIDLQIKNELRITMMKLNEGSCNRTSKSGHF